MPIVQTCEWVEQSEQTYPVLRWHEPNPIKSLSSDDMTNEALELLRSRVEPGHGQSFYRDVRRAVRAIVNSGQVVRTNQIGSQGQDVVGFVWVCP